MIMYEKLLKAVRSVLYVFSVTAMSIMLITIFCQVITRYWFNYTPEWSEELARFLFVWVVFLGSALIMGDSGHLAVQFIPDMLKGTKKGKVVAIIINLSSYVFIGILLTKGLEMTATMTFQLSPGMNIPMSYIYSVIPISSILMLLYLIKSTIEIIYGSSDHEETLTD